MTTVNKKEYRRPVAGLIRTDIRQQLMAGSVTPEGNIITGTPQEGNAGDAAAPESNFWDVLWTVLLMTVMAVTAQAQHITTVSPAAPPADYKTHAMKLYLKNSTEVSYTMEQLDHVTYLPGIGMKVWLKGQTQSVDYLFGQMTRIDYTEDANGNANWKTFSMTGSTAEAWRLEYPQLSSRTEDVGTATNCQVVVKRTEDYGITYSVEWDNAKAANRWTCYQLHEGNAMSTAKRKDDFKRDPEVAVTPELEDYSNSGFSRGHLCPSADRLCSTEQNKQTFFLTNMQPQYQSHNGGLWSRLEKQVRDYATNDDMTGEHCDTLYIVKAATIGDITLDGTTTEGVYAEKCNGRLPVPKYFYMALLHYNKELESYQAIAFWTNHLSTTQQVADLSQYAISIDELERRTGMDFFCNLPDDIEEYVESSCDLEFWHLNY